MAAINTSMLLRILEDGSVEANRLIRREIGLDASISSAMQTSLNNTWPDRTEDISPSSHVGRIISEVKSGGDQALQRFTKLFDGSEYGETEVSEEEIVEAFKTIPIDDLEAIQFAVARIKKYHEDQLKHGPQSFMKRSMGWSVRPLTRVGIYMTGGEAALPSSVIHTAVPAVVAGVKELVGFSAPMNNGKINPHKLVAARLSGIDKVYRGSGAQALAAMAYGTEVSGRVDKVFGPGGLFVTLAKKQLFGDVGIDSIYGPTETLVIADQSASPSLAAADLLAQAEHDVLATPILLCDSSEFAERTAEYVNEQIMSLERREIAEAAISRGGAIVVENLSRAVDLSNEFAPEHLCLLVRAPEELIESITNCGGIFVGESSPEVLGDYTAGPSHVMPTGGSARWASPLSVLDFLKITSIVALDDDELLRLGPDAAILARAEGLTGHALSIERRLQR